MGLVGHDGSFLMRGNTRIELAVGPACVLLRLRSPLRVGTLGPLRIRPVPGATLDLAIQPDAAALALLEVAAVAV